MKNFNIGHYIVYRDLSQNFDQNSLVFQFLPQMKANAGHVMAAGSQILHASWCHHEQ